MKLALINCYFGKLPNYFELWLQSCAANSKVDFILITDAETPNDIPSNVKIIPFTFEELVRKINSKFDFKVSIRSPYKLTDFKPAYGYIFEDLFRPYDYWGYCDIDLIFGNLMKFLKNPLEQGVEKIYRLGHLTIYKNTNRMKQLFQQKGAMFSYREVFSRPELYSFDEHAGQMLIAKKQAVSEYYKEDMADISCRLKRMTASRHINYPEQVFYYDNGEVYRAYLVSNQIKIEEFIYIHIQKREYKYLGLYNTFYILSNTFVQKMNGLPSENDIKKFSEFKSDIIDYQQLSSFRTKKIKEFLGCSLRKKRIWLLTKMAENRFA